MIERVARRITILDAMILTAASALGFAGMRWYAPSVFSASLHSDLDPRLDACLRAGSYAVAALPLALAFTLAMPVLALLHSRMRMRFLLRRRGILACVTVSLGGLVVTGFWAVGMLIAYFAVPGNKVATSRDNASDIIKFLAPVSLGPIVLVVWMVTAWTRRSLPARSWVDHVSFALGLYWVAFSLLEVVLLVCDYTPL